MKTREEMSEEVDRLERLYWNAKEEYYSAYEELKAFDAAEREKNKTPEERIAELQTRSCGCICGCREIVHGRLYSGQVYFGRCIDCALTNCG